MRKCLAKRPPGLSARFTAAAVSRMSAATASMNHGVITVSSDPGAIGGGPSSRLQDIAIFSAYTGCFRTLAVITVVIIPGIFLFRVLRRESAIPTVA